MHAFFSLTDSVQNHENEPSSVTLAPSWTVALIVSSVFVVAGVVTIKFYPGTSSKARCIGPGKHTASKLISTSRADPENLTFVHLETPDAYEECAPDSNGLFTLVDGVYYLFLDSESLFFSSIVS